MADAMHGQAQFIQTDLSSDVAIVNAVKTIHDSFGKVDYLVNLAYTYLDDGFKSSREDWLQALNINLLSAVELTRAFYEDLKTKHGAIVNFTSISAKFAQTGRWLYPIQKQRCDNSLSPWRWILQQMGYELIQYHLVGHGHG